MLIYSLQGNIFLIYFWLPLYIDFVSMDVMTHVSNDIFILLFADKN